MKRIIALVTLVVVVQAFMPAGAAGLKPCPTSAGCLGVTAVDTIGMTVADMDRALDFYIRVLTFEKVSDVEVSGREYELMEGVFGARMRVARLRLGRVD